MKEFHVPSKALAVVRFASTVSALLYFPRSASGLTAQAAGQLSRASGARKPLDAEGHSVRALDPAKSLHQDALRAIPSAHREELHDSHGHGEIERPPAGREPPLALVDRAEKVGADFNMTASLDCIENNGGSCLVQNCYSWRGSQTCHLGRCFCTAGQCAGTDGMCHDQQNVLVAHRVRLRNVRYPDYHLYMSNFNFEVWVGRTPGDQADFELRQLPNGGYASDPQDFLLTSSRYTGYAVNVRETQSCDSDNHCTSKLKAGTEHIVYPMDTGIQYLALNFERIPERPEAVMIASYMYPRTHLYVPRMSWQVDTYDNDPGTGGYWVFEPPLSNETMDKLRMYHGPRCTFMCGLARAVAPSHAIALLLALPLLFSSAS